MAKRTWWYKGSSSKQSAYRRVDKAANKCEQDTVFGRPNFCTCAACIEAYKERIKQRKADPNEYIPPHLYKPKEQNPTQRRVYVSHNIANPREVDPYKRRNS